MSKDNSTTSNGFSFSTVLFLIFLILKLTNTINWSWWWVTCPLWIGWAALILFIIILMTINSLK